MATVRKRTYIEKQRIQHNYYVMASIYALGLEHARKEQKKAAQSNTVGSQLTAYASKRLILFFPADALTLSVTSLPWLPSYSGQFLRSTSWPMCKGSTVLSNQVPYDWVIYTASERGTRSFFSNSFSYPVCCSTDIFKAEQDGFVWFAGHWMTTCLLTQNPLERRSRWQGLLLLFIGHGAILELYVYDTVLGTISFLWWLYRSCVGNWVKIFPP